ncbi:MAG: hypothetical protein GQ525_06710 [Draconibacterium sp.]|nr:hypothetical protein [Draconibacterium sp.]
MFFVGATGQLLTLLLTVCLPFVFLLSGHQKIEHSQNNSKLEIFQRFDNGIQLSKTSIKIKSQNIYEIQSQYFVFEFSPPNKTKQEFVLTKLKSLTQNCFGNRAPPSLS